MPDTLLPSQIHDDKTERKIRGLARRHLPLRGEQSVFFEHGHWWVSIRCQIFDVVDAEPSLEGSGFAFEEV